MKKQTLKTVSETEPLYRIFYINHGKYFVSKVDGNFVSQAITKYHEEFKNKCLWFTFKQAVKIIKRNRHSLEIWGVVDNTGKQKTVGKFDGILKNN